MPVISGPGLDLAAILGFHGGTSRRRRGVKDSVAMAAQLRVDDSPEAAPREPLEYELS
jgi:hypothetical protein